jgi:putative transposase
MKKTKFTESQIIGNSQRAGTGQEDGRHLPRTRHQPAYVLSMEEQVLRNDVNQLRRVKELEAELAQYKRMVAEQALDIRILKDLNSKKF